MVQSLALPTCYYLYTLGGCTAILRLGRCVTRCPFNIGDFATLAALAEVCGVLSAILGCSVLMPVSHVDVTCVN